MRYVDLIRDLKYFGTNLMEVRYISDGDIWTVTTKHGVHIYAVDED